MSYFETDYCSYTTIVRLCEIFFDYAEIAERSLPANRTRSSKQNIQITADLFEATVKNQARTDWTEDERKQADRGVNRVAGMIDVISRHMDRYFAQGGYEVPLPESAWPNIELICATLTRCKLYDDNRPEYMQIDCNKAEAELKAIAESKTDIPGLEKTGSDIVVRDLHVVIPTTLGNDRFPGYIGNFRTSDVD